VHAPPRGKAKRVAITLDVLHHHYAVGSGGHRSSSHDFDGLARADLNHHGIAGANRTNHFKRHTGGNVGGSAGKPIAGRAGKRRLVPIRQNRLCQHPAERIEQSNDLRSMPRRQPVSMLAHDPARIRIAHHPGWR
jgi:hypothetical protein